LEGYNNLVSPAYEFNQLIYVLLSSPVEG